MSLTANTPHANRNYKDSMFRKLFDNEEKVLELYNALSGKKYPEGTKVEIVTLDDVFYNDFKNDLAFIIDEKFINLTEHQSTLSPNLPLRFLEYIAKEYHKLYFSNAVYSKTPVSLPTPEFYVLYNGSVTIPKEQELKLSDTFAGECDKISLELIVHVIDVNYDKSSTILQKSSTLRDYSIFVNKVRSRRALHSDLDTAISESIDECIKEGRLVDFFKKNRGEIMSFLHVQLSQEEREEIREKDGYIKGREEGIKEGIKEGINQGLKEGLEKGLAEGFNNAILDTAVKMKAAGIPVEQIIAISGLDRKVIEEL